MNIFRAISGPCIRFPIVPTASTQLSRIYLHSLPLQITLELHLPFRLFFREAPIICSAWIVVGMVVRASRGTFFLQSMHLSRPRMNSCRARPTLPLINSACASAVMHGKLRIPSFRARDPHSKALTAPSKSNKSLLQIPRACQT